tara:strand:+ start:157 stop:591 length:435 start_codon:yes stop_codon:yes gene_type:complete
MNQKNSEQGSEVVFGCIPSRLFLDSALYIDTVRAGIPGLWLARVALLSGIGKEIGKTLGMSEQRFEAACQMDTLDTRTSEAVLEIARVLSVCFSVWESQALGKAWLGCHVPALGEETPLSLMDTHEGRCWLMEVLRKIEGGDFS